jgi:hypothetical protein
MQNVIERLDDMDLEELANMTKLIYNANVLTYPPIEMIDVLEKKVYNFKKIIKHKDEIKRVFKNEIFPHL